MHKNNFDFLRLLFAIFVVITHSYSLSGIDENDLIAQLTGGQTSFSYLGVAGFFIISGYLIFQSMLRSSSLASYFKKRFLRLFPGLIFVLVLTVCLGYFVYDNKWGNYFKNYSMWCYLPNNLSLYNLQFDINGVLKGAAINGSLWTIRYEFSFYILISLLFFFRKRKCFLKKILTCIFIFLLVFKYFLFQNLGAGGIALGNSKSLYLGLFFIGGSILAVLRLENSSNKTFFFLAVCVAFCLSFYCNIFYYGQFILLPLLVILAGVSSTRYIHSLSDRFGDISYGVYIYSFPIQQTLMYFFSLKYLQLMAISLPISILFGMLSWHLIEKKALEFKYRAIIIRTNQLDAKT